MTHRSRRALWLAVEVAGLGLAGYAFWLNRARITLPLGLLLAVMVLMAAASEWRAFRADGAERA